MTTNTALTILAIILVVFTVATMLWALVIAPFWVPWHSHRR
jgi:hypothetical protein